METPSGACARHPKGCVLVSFLFPIMPLKTSYICKNLPEVGQYVLVTLHPISKPGQLRRLAKTPVLRLRRVHFSRLCSPVLERACGQPLSFCSHLGNGHRASELHSVSSSSNMLSTDD